MNPIKWYTNKIKDSINPPKSKYEMIANIEIKKGQKEGSVTIPNSVYTVVNSIDFNPSLIRKVDKKFIKNLPVNKKIDYDSNKYDVILTKEEEEKGYQLKELKKCSKCGSKVVIAELCEVEHVRDPLIKVKISDKAKENLKIPIKLRLTNMPSVLKSIIFLYICLFSIGWILNEILFNPIYHNFFALIIFMPLFSFLFLFLIPQMIYSRCKFFIWYFKTKPLIRKL